MGEGDICLDLGFFFIFFFRGGFDLGVFDFFSQGGVMLPTS